MDTPWLPLQRSRNTNITGPAWLVLWLCPLNHADHLSECTGSDTASDTASMLRATHMLRKHKEVGFLLGFLREDKQSYGLKTDHKPRKCLSERALSSVYR